MAHNERLDLYRQIEHLRARPLLVYVTSTRANASGAMGSDVIPQFAKHISRLPFDSGAVDLLVVSTGGDPTVSWRIITMLRERFQKVGVLLPSSAYSAATLLALGADEIVMHPFSNIGPVDPQLSYTRRVPGGSGEDAVETVLFGAEDLRHFLDFVRSEVGISDQEQLERAFELVCKDVGTIPIGVAKRASHLAVSMGEKLLGLHMGDQNKAKAIAEALNRSFYHHGYALGPAEAEGIGLPVRRVDKDLEDLIWAVWEDIEADMECNRPFNAVEVILSNPAAAALLGPVPQVQLPANLPPQLLQQALNSVLQQIQVVQVPPSDYAVFNAALEGTRARSEYRTEMKIAATRLPDMNIRVSVVPTKQGWEFHETPQA